MEIISQLQSAKQKTLSLFQLSESDLNKTYGKDKWNIKQILHHLADAECVLYDRIKRIISEPKQVIWAFDQDLWCKNLNYQDLPLEISEKIYESTRNAIIFYTRKFYEILGDKTFIHSETGVPLKDEIDKVAWHNQNHLEQIEMALKKI